MYVVTVALLISCSNPPTATPEPTPTSTPTATPEPTPTPSQTPTATPTPISNSHSNDEIARSVESVNRAVQLATLEGDQPDLDGMRALSIAECRPADDSELIESAGDLRALFEVGDYQFEVTGVERISGDHAWVSGYMEVHGENVASVPPSLVVFEDGYWRDAQCKVVDDPGLQPPNAPLSPVTVDP